MNMRNITYRANINRPYFSDIVKDVVLLIDCLVDYVIIIRTIIYDLAYNFIIQ